MTKSELMELCAEKAVQELEWESIEFLFRPSNLLELFLRLDFDGMSSKIKEWAGTARLSEFLTVAHAVAVEEFYREIQSCKLNGANRE